MDNHNVNHYVIAAFLAITLGGGLLYVHQEKPKVELTHVRVGAHDWPELTEKQTIDLGEELNKLNPKQDHIVTLLCQASSCQNFRDSIHEAFTIAWYGDDYEDLGVESEHDHGLFIGPPGKEADGVKAAFKKILNIDAKIVGIGDIEGSVGVIFGKYDGK